jgi:hypothetical protein
MSSLYNELDPESKPNTLPLNMIDPYVLEGAHINVVDKDPKNDTVKVKKRKNSTK